jgi:hypothetical protein
VVSSEWFADASDAAARIIADALERDRVHVVLTVRPLASVAPSQWQQYVQAGTTIPFEPWLEGVLQRPGSITPSFWVRHRHDELAARWAAVVGPDRVTVVVADDRDRGAILRAFERLAGLPAGLLVPDDDRANRSLTAAEIELIRRTNAGLKSEGLSQLKQKLVLFGAAARLKSRLPGHDEPRIEIPAWARQPIAEAAQSIVDGLRGSGVRVVGDLESLAAPLEGLAPPSSEMPAVAPWAEIVARGAMGVVIEGGLAHDRGRGRGSASEATTALAAIPTARLREAFVGRVLRAAGSRLATRRRPRRDSAPPPPIHSTSEVE